MYLGELLHYQSSNNLPQSVQTLDSPSQSFILCVAKHLELLFSLLTCLSFNLSSFVLLNTLSSPDHCRLVSASIFAALVCLTLRVALLVVALSRVSQPFLLCVEKLETLCSLFSCRRRQSKYSYFRQTGATKVRVFR